MPTTRDTFQVQRYKQVESKRMKTRYVITEMKAETIQ